MRNKVLFVLLWALGAAPVPAAVVEVRLEAPSAPAVSFSAGASALGPGLSTPSLPLSLTPSLSAPSIVPQAPVPLGPSLAQEIPGVFFQIEQEGNLLRSDPKDSSGDVFRYYKPAELRPDLLKKTESALTGFDRMAYSLKSLWGLLTRSDPGKVWNALPLSGKLAYLDGLEKAVVAEKGEDAAWKGKNFLLLSKSERAPDFVAEHPDMEEPPTGKLDGQLRFIQPEIVSAKDKPARTAREAIGRTRRVIADTGHAGTQYHAFVKLAPGTLSAQLDALLDAVASVNEALFLEAAIDSPENLFHGSLKPWHAGRSRRVRALVAAAGPARQPSWKDFDSEKHAYLGVRWWGMEDGKAVVSLELRGASIPWKREGSAATRGVEGAAPTMTRDYSQVERWLGVVASAAGRLSAGVTARSDGEALELDAAAAAAALSELSAKHGAPPVSVADLEALSEAIGAGPGVHPAMIYPLAAGSRGGYADELWRQALSSRHPDFNARLAKYSLWTAFGGWAHARLPDARRRAGI